MSTHNMFSWRNKKYIQPRFHLCQFSQKVTLSYPNRLTLLFCQRSVGYIKEFWNRANSVRILCKSVGNQETDLLITSYFEDNTTDVLLFVCVEVLWPRQPNGVMSSVVSLPDHTFTGQA